MTFKPWNTIKIFRSNLNPSDVSWLLLGSTIRSINSRLVVDDDVSYNHNASFSRFAAFFRPRNNSENYNLCQFKVHFLNLSELKLEIRTLIKNHFSSLKAKGEVMKLDEFLKNSQNVEKI